MKPALLSRWALTTLMVSAGVLHFVRPQPFVDIVPDYLPAPLLLVHVSGVFELLGGLGLVLPQTRRVAAWGLVALFVAVFPANVHMALHAIVPAGTPPLPGWVLWVRLLLQPLLILWAYRFTREPRGRAASPTPPAA